MINRTRRVISVFGSSRPLPGSATYESARLVGRLLAEADFIVQTGGYSGVMAGASQGASEAGGHVIGVTSTQIESFRPAPPNPWVKEEIRTQSLRERLLYVVDNCLGAIVMPGGIGTLSEMSLIWSFVQTGEITPCPIVTVGELWQRTLELFSDDQYITVEHQKLITVALTAHEAVNKITENISKGEDL